MTKIKTYGEIEYYLYDGDKKEKEVSKKTFFSSDDVNVKHYTQRKESPPMKSETGFVIEHFSEFINNLPLNYNKQSVKFDGGDGPSGTEIVEPHKSIVKNIKKPNGNTAKREQKIRKLEKDKNKVLKISDFKQDYDVFAIDKSPTVHAGGRSTA